MPDKPNDRPANVAPKADDPAPRIYLVIGDKQFVRPSLETYYARTPQAPASSTCSCNTVAGTFCSCNKVCTCNLVCSCQGHGVCQHSVPRYGGGGGGGTYCSCNRVCTCVPVY